MNNPDNIFMLLKEIEAQRERMTKAVEADNEEEKMICITDLFNLQSQLVDLLLKGVSDNESEKKELH